MTLSTKTYSSVVSYASASAVAAISKDTCAKSLYNEGATTAKLSSSTDNDPMYGEVQKGIRAGFAAKHPGLEALFAKDTKDRTEAQKEQYRKLTTAMSGKMGDIRAAVGKLEAKAKKEKAIKAWTALANKWVKDGSKAAGKKPPRKPDIMLTAAELKARKAGKSTPPTTQDTKSKAVEKLNAALDEFAKSYGEEDSECKNLNSAITRMRNAASKLIE